MKNKIPNKQIGWSEQSNMIYEVLRELNALNNQLYLQTCCTTDTSTTDGPTPPPPPPTTTTTTTNITPTTTTSSTEPPCCTLGTLEVNVTAPGTTINVITVDDGNAWYDVGGLGLPIDNVMSPASVSLTNNIGGTLQVYVDNLTAGDVYLYIYLDCVQIGSCCVVPADTTGHLCTFADFNISDYANQCMKIELTNISCT
jgi:hypothetical protein